MTVSPITGLCVRKATFRYRRRVTITELSGNDLTDYQVRIDLDATNFDFSHFLNGGEDLAFTDAEGNLLPYWVEKMDIVAEEATIWVEVPSIPANSSVDIFMYYGSQTVESASDCDAVFIFADDGEKKGVVCKYYPAGLSTVKPAIIDGKKFIVIGAGFYSQPDKCYVIECDENWDAVNTHESPFTGGEVFVPTTAGTIPGKLIFLSCKYAKLVLFDISSGNFDYVESSEPYFVNLKMIGDYYYLEPAWGRNYFYKFHKNDVLNMDNWIRIDMPTPSIEKKEYRMDVFNNFLYILRFNQVDYPFSLDLIRYDPMTDTFETIIPETGDTTDVSTFIFPQIFADDSRVILAFPKSSPSPHYDIMLSTDGVNFTTIAEEEIFCPSCYSMQEMHCNVFIINDKIYAMPVQDELRGHVSVYDLEGNLLIRDWANITTHDTENAFWFDGDFVVLGGEDTFERKYQVELKFIPTDYTKLSDKWTYSTRAGQVARFRDGRQGNFGFHIFNAAYEGMFPVSKNEMPTVCEAFAWVYPRSSDTEAISIVMRAAENEGTYYEIGIESAGKFKIGKSIGGSYYTELASTAIDFQVNVWRKIVARMIDSTIIGELYDENESLIAELVATDSDIPSGRAGFGAWSYADVDYDCFIVRKYTEPEPLISIGEEETA